MYLLWFVCNKFRQEKRNVNESRTMWKITYWRELFLYMPFRHNAYSYYDLNYFFCFFCFQRNAFLWTCFKFRGFLFISGDLGASMFKAIEGEVNYKFTQDRNVSMAMQRFNLTNQLWNLTLQLNNFNRTSYINQ